MRTAFFLVFLLSTILPGLANADESDEQDSSLPPPSLRESIDSIKEKIAANFFDLQISAFGDAHSSYTDAGNQTFDWGSFEVNATIDSGNELQAAIAIVKDSEMTQMTVGFLDYNTSGGPIAPRGRLWVEKGFHIQVGRFDVPFGSDWQFFASKDSVSVSRPLSTELVMDGGYNDEGIRVLGNDGSINFNTFLLHGFNGGRLLGGRIGITPFTDPFSIQGAREPKNFEFGLSYLYDADKNLKSKNETAYAVDTEVHLDAWTGRFEYISRKKDPLLSNGIDRLSGWHITQEYTLPEAFSSWPTTIFARYDRSNMRPAEIESPDAATGNDRDTRITLGFRTDLGNSNLVQLKFELQRYLNATPSTRETPGYSNGLLMFTQLVVLL